MRRVFVYIGHVIGVQYLNGIVSGSLLANFLRLFECQVMKRSVYREVLLRLMNEGFLLGFMGQGEANF